jgi:hypothetical protein
VNLKTFEGEPSALITHGAIFTRSTTGEE